MLKAIWPSTARIPNHLSPNANITSVGQYLSLLRYNLTTVLTTILTGMMCYFLYWLIQLPLVLVSPRKIKHFFTLKSIVVPLAWLGILIWAVVKVPVKPNFDPVHTKLSGSILCWAWLSALNSALGSFATLAVNIPDFTVSGLSDNLGPDSVYIFAFVAIRQKRTSVSPIPFSALGSRIH